jgi:hypothetical protein
LDTAIGKSVLKRLATVGVSVTPFPSLAIVALTKILAGRRAADIVACTDLVHHGLQRGHRCRVVSGIKSERCASQIESFTVFSSVVIRWYFDKPQIIISSFF